MLDSCSGVIDRLHAACEGFEVGVVSFFFDHAHDAFDLFGAHSHVFGDPSQGEAEGAVFAHGVGHLGFAAVQGAFEVDARGFDDVGGGVVALHDAGDAQEVAQRVADEADAFGGLGYEAGFGDLVAGGGHLRVGQQVVAGGAGFCGDVFDGLFDDGDISIHAPAWGATATTDSIFRYVDDIIRYCEQCAAAVAY